MSDRIEDPRNIPVVDVPRDHEQLERRGVYEELRARGEMGPAKPWRGRGVVVYCDVCDRALASRELPPDEANLSAINYGWTIAAIASRTGAPSSILHLCPVCTETRFGASLRHILKASLDRNTPKS